MALDFPPSPSVGQPFPDPPAPPRWVFNGTSWVSAPVSTALYLPLTGGTLTGPGNLTVRGLTHLDDDATVDGDVTVTGGVTADHVTTTGTSLDVSGSATIGGTLTVDGATEFKNSVEIQGEPVATEDWTMQQVAAGGLWQGVWDPATNTPDLTDTATHFDGYTWAVVTSDPTASFTIPATPVIPGLNGKVVWTGYNVIWSDSASEFQIVPGGGMSLTAAQDMFLAKTGGSLVTGQGGANGALNVPGGFTAGSSFHATGSVFNVNIGGSVFINSGGGATAGVHINTGFTQQTQIGQFTFSGSTIKCHGSMFIIDNTMGSNGVNFLDNSGNGVQLNGQQLATQQYVQNNQVTLAGGLPTTGGTLAGPGGANGNLTVQGTFQHNGTTAALANNTMSMSRTTAANYESRSIWTNFSYEYYHSQWSPTSTYTKQVQFGDGWTIVNPQNYPTAGFVWGNIIRIGGSELTCMTFTPFYEFNGDHNISVQHLGYTGPPGSPSGGGGPGVGQGGLTFFLNNPWQTPNAWGTFFASYGAAGWNPKIFSLGALQGGTSPFICAHNEAFKPGGGPWDTLSDGRTKTDVQDYTAGLSELTKLNPIRFRYNGRARMQETGKSYIGLHAEEAQKVMPEMVYSKKGKLDYDDGETDILYMNANALAYATINALKELTERIEALEAKLK